MPPVIDKKKCIGCFKCVQICPLDVYGRQKKEYEVPVIRYPEECWHCNACAIDCPKKAIHIRVPVPGSVVFIDAPQVLMSKKIN